MLYGTDMVKERSTDARCDRPEGENALPFTMLSSTLLNLDLSWQQKLLQNQRATENNNANQA